MRSSLLKFPVIILAPNNKYYVTGPNGQGRQGNNTTPGGYEDVSYVPSVWDKFKDSGIGIDQVGATGQATFAIEQE